MIFRWCPSDFLIFVCLDLSLLVNYFAPMDSLSLISPVRALKIKKIKAATWWICGTPCIPFVPGPYQDNSGWQISLKVKTCHRDASSSNKLYHDKDIPWPTTLKLLVSKRQERTFSPFGNWWTVKEPFRYIFRLNL